MGTYGALFVPFSAAARTGPIWLEKVGETDAVVLAEHAERGGNPDRAAVAYQRAAEHALAAWPDLAD